jgi:AcrR family transcriptional regulator
MNRRSPSEPAVTSLRDRIRETTAQAIMDAAEDVFADEGLHAARMGDIAARAGVAVGTVYNHFQDREALLAGLVAARRSELLAQLDAAARAPGDRPFLERLRALLVVMLTHAQSHRKFFHIMLQAEVGRYQQTFPSACSLPGDTMREVFARVDRLMKHGVREGELRQDIADLLPVVFLGMVRALAIRAVVLRSETDFVGEADRLLGFFLRGAAA